MLRLTGGTFRGRTIQAPPHQRTRPTQSKLRQALFNSIQGVIPDSRVLDLFAGSGALGFEALSRGASEVVFVEISRSVGKLIQKNAETLDVSDQVRIFVEPVADVLETLLPLGPFDVILADPPYGEGWEGKLLHSWPWEKILNPNGRLCLEWGGQLAHSQGREKKSQDGQNESQCVLPEKLPFLEKIREKKYGDSVLTTYLRSEV